MRTWLEGVGAVMRFASEDCRGGERRGLESRRECAKVIMWDEGSGEGG